MSLGGAPGDSIGGVTQLAAWAPSKWLGFTTHLYAMEKKAILEGE